jgi:hypothetical protein
MMQILDVPKPTNDDYDFLSERLLITTLVAVMESRIVVDVGCRC